jgi:DNA polymerase elongation subunit (family B)
MPEKQKVSPEVIEAFLNGRNPKKYVVGVEATYNEPYVHLIVNDPAVGKTIEKHEYQSFLWFKHEVTQIMYEGKRLKIIEACQRHGVKIKKLTTADPTGYTPARLENGYRYMITCKKSYNDLIQFFKEGGIDVFDRQYSKLFFNFSPVEQFMIQTGIRLFKGMDDYNDLHRFQFDLETEGLFGSRDAIFQIGVRDNKGIEHVFETKGNTLQQKRDSERENIIKFFQTINFLKPDIITGYNSESFDWSFIVDRCERLSLDIDRICVGLDGLPKFKRKPAMLKLGNEMEPFLQTFIYGHNIIDIAHSVRRAMAINSDIKSWGLKYITQYAGVAKKNRVYVPGNLIHTTWSDAANQYAFNENNGDWYKISERMPLKDGYEAKTGSFIVQRYLLDDLWETEQIDVIFNQAAFLISKILPTTYSRSSTMGTASQWKLIMAAWSFENNLAIPETESKRDFTGGLSRLLQLGYNKNVVKLDYAALYPKSQLTHNIYPDLDISGVMEGMLTYVVDTRDKFKFLTGEHKDIVKELKSKIKEMEGTKYIQSELDTLKDELKKNQDLVGLYDKKQLPLKILANSWFGAYGAPYIFNWGDSDCAEETTCRGRQYLRLMVKHFCEKYGFKALVGDSVVFDTPIYLLNNKTKQIEIRPICDLFDSKAELLDEEGLRDYNKKPYLVLTANGWKGINYVYRHETDKTIHRVSTKDRMVCVTEDHSLFQDQKQVKPSNLIRHDKIDIYEYPIYTCNRVSDNEDLFWLYGFFLGDGSSVYGPRKQYYKSRKTGKINTNKGIRAEWKISNQNTEFLERLKKIIEVNFPDVKASVKNHMKSSNVYNLVVCDTGFSKWFSEQFYTSYREKMIPSIVLNTSDVNKRAFMNGVCASDGYGNDLENVSDIGMKSQVAMAGISYLLKGCGINMGYKLKLRKDKENFISFKLRNRNRNNSEFTETTQMKTNEVWLNNPVANRDKNKFVYDISTEDGTFVGGIGGMILKNTDGFNFAFPDNIDEVRYVAKGSHWKTEKNADKELVGLEAVLAEFNEEYMIGRMGLDIDDVCNSTINFSRKNYANDIGGKIKLVGNSIKSKKMPVYIEDFLAKAIRMLLDGDGKSFITYYQDYVDKIYNHNIPLVKIASKSKVKSTLSDYRKRATKKNKAGNPMPKQAHMELALRAGIDVGLGDTLYYVNTGKLKSHGDLKSVKMENGTTEVQLNCRLIEPGIVENDMEMIREMDSLKKMLIDIDRTETQQISEIEEKIAEMEEKLATEEYNVAKYLEAFNKKVKPLLVCFHTDIRSKILLTIKKDKKTKLEKLDDKNIFTEVQCQLVSGMPNEDGDQDTYEELMTMEDKEIKFWDKVNKVPNNMEEAEWNRVRADYHIRKAQEKIDGIIYEQEKLDNIFKRLEAEDIRRIEKTQAIPDEVIVIATVDEDGNFVSRKWDAVLCPIDEIFKYEADANDRQFWYQQSGVTKDKYEAWIAHKIQEEVMTITGQTETVISEKTLKTAISKVQERITEKENSMYIPRTVDKDEDEDDDDDEDEVKDEIDDFIPELQKASFVVEQEVIRKTQNVLLSQVSEKLKTKEIVHQAPPEPPKPFVLQEAAKKVQTMKTTLKLNEDGFNF